MKDGCKIISTSVMPCQTISTTFYDGDNKITQFLQYIRVTFFLMATHIYSSVECGIFFIVQNSSSNQRSGMILEVQIRHFVFWKLYFICYNFFLSILIKHYYVIHFCIIIKKRLNLVFLSWSAAKNVFLVF